MEQHPKAVALSERAMTITEKNPGANTPDHAASLVALARALTAAKQLDKAEPPLPASHKDF
jgi:tetratricopeptide repeat protein